MKVEIIAAKQCTSNVASLYMVEHNHFVVWAELLSVGTSFKSVRPVIDATKFKPNLTVVIVTEVCSSTCTLPPCNACSSTSADSKV